MSQVTHEMDLPLGLVSVSKRSGRRHDASCARPLGLAPPFLNGRMPRMRRIPQRDVAVLIHHRWTHRPAADTNVAHACCASVSPATPAVCPSVVCSPLMLHTKRNCAIELQSSIPPPARN